jgi:DNA invertase Pin-like site-specific DNA recombinase
MARRLYDDERNSIADICRTLGISRSTLYRCLALSSPTRETEEGRS